MGNSYRKVRKGCPSCSTQESKTKRIRTKVSSSYGGKLIHKKFHVIHKSLELEC